MVLDSFCSSGSIDVSDIKHTLCVAVSSAQSLVLVKPSQLIKVIPSDVNLEPFLYQVPPDIAQYEHFLTAVGVPQHLSANHCVDVLYSIFHQLQEINRTLSNSNRFKSIALSAYNHLVCTLRKGDCGKLHQDLYLPSEDDELVPLEELVFNDAPWYSGRLPRGEVFKFLKLPLPDANGEKILPESLGVRKLTSVVCEKLHEDMKLNELTCKHEKRYTRDKSKPRCNIVKNTLKSLQSNELKDGLLRVYYSERRERPSQQFEQTLQRLDTVRISCVTSDGVHTVLIRDGAVIKGSESSDRHCLALNETERDVLVIAPHDRNFSEVDFIQYLSKALNCILQNEIKNESYLTTMLKCAPEDIEGELNRQQVDRYDPKTIKETKYLQAGEVIDFSSFTLADSLLITNFNTGEIVLHYYDKNKKIIVAAKVVHVNDSEKYEEIVVTLSLKHVRDPNEKEYQVQVSPACIFKILTPPQQIMLFSTNPNQFQVRATAEPVIFAPVSDKKEDIDLLLKTKFFEGIPRETAMMRLIVHIHFSINGVKNHLNQSLNSSYRTYMVFYRQ